MTSGRVGPGDVLGMLTVLVIVVVTAVGLSDVGDPLVSPRPDTSTAAIVADEAVRAGVDPRLALALLAVENPARDSVAVSTAGAVGLFQVVPRWWAGRFAVACGPGDATRLVERRYNACVGLRALAYYLERERPSVARALCAYHGSLAYPRACARYVTNVLDAAFGGLP